MGNGINVCRLPEGYRDAPLITSALATADRRRTDQLGTIQATADRERIDQAMAIRAAADQERIDQAMAIQAAADQTIAENAEVCLISFYSF